MMPSISAKPRLKATSGEITMGMTTFSRTTDQVTPTLAATAAPTSPPIRAWEEDDGRP